MKTRFAAFLLTFATIASAQATTYTTVFCLSKSHTHDAYISVIDGQRTDYAYKYNAISGENLDVTESRTVEYSNRAFVFTGKAGGQQLTVRYDLKTSAAVNATIQAEAQVESARCFIGDTVIDP
jgi:hypothetical protein